MSKSKCNSIHEKAIRLLEGGFVEVDGHSVYAVKAPIDSNPCEICSMDCMCVFGKEMPTICIECDSISNSDYYLKLGKRKK